MMLPKRSFSESGISLFITMVILLVSSMLVLLAFRGVITQLKLNHSYEIQVDAHSKAEALMIEILSELNNQIQSSGWPQPCKPGSQSSSVSSFCIQSHSGHSELIIPSLTINGVPDAQYYSWISIIAEPVTDQIFSFQLRAYPSPLQPLTLIDNSMQWNSLMLAGIEVGLSKKHPLVCDDIVDSAIENSQRDGILGGVLNSIIPGMGGLANLDALDSLQILVGSLANAEVLAGLRDVRALIPMLSDGEVSLNPDLGLNAEVLDALRLSACVAAGLQIDQNGVQLDVDAGLFAGLNIPVLSPLLSPLLDGLLGPLGKLTGSLNLLGKDKLITLDLSLLSDITVLDPLIKGLPVLNVLGVTKEGTGLIGQLLSDGTLVGDLLGILGVSLGAGNDQAPVHIVRWVELNSSVL